MMKKAKRVLCAHDLSGIGRCSLTTALPILSSAGLEACPLPTALLSTQTGGISDYSYLDLTDEMPKMLSHWKKLGLSFDGIYTGYLGKPAQVPVLKEAIEYYHGAFVLVDPVMGDAQELYQGFSPEYIPGFRSLMPLADLTTPNLTEACLLAGVDPRLPMTPTLETDLAFRVRDLGAKDVVITGIARDNEIGCLVLSSELDKPVLLLQNMVPGIYHGSGDLLACIVMASRMNGLPLLNSVRLALDFTVRAIVRTRDLGIDPRFGLDFERDLPRLIHRIQGGIPEHE